MEGRRSSYLLPFMALVVAAMLHSSAAQTRHVVGDSMNWIIPPGGAAAYATWAASKTFRVGDVLVFNYNTGAHDVAEVTRAAYDSCNVTAPISLSTNGPTTINLTSAGEHHYICAVGRHCEAGQKLSINVVSTAPASQPPAAAPQPVTPSPRVVSPTPAPSPSAGAGTVYTVGDSLGWIVPSNGQAEYQNWATGKNFVVGDTLVFSFANGRHDVLEVTQAEFESCNVSTTTTAPIASSPARVVLDSAREHYYICAVPNHCSLGQKLAINVTNSDSKTNPSTPIAPPPERNHAVSLSVAALPLALLAAALAFLHN